ncbi:hypothetical protein DAEQUDRAFT_723438 [Daedalea quercina L-15889]|uniref:Uncharacterized protein n=1 Tax=Daedalea quercina L-15889 TaxID=1314783 RepID=A0A165SMX7_9APHY|nr:hypothetical protein DAEQUDRAFT_723438 [Daedalea quercina L-15889]
MAAFNVSLDDSSPLITYSPSNAWTDTPANDTTASTYFDASLHTTNTQGAYASFAFNGTGVWLYGGLRSNYGNYQISVDGEKVTSGSAKSTKTQVKHALGGTSGLQMGEHTVTLMNEGGGPVDLDSLVFETKAGTTGGSVTNTTIDDANSSVKYGPNSNSWISTNGTDYFDKTLHYSTTNGAYATLSFTGNAVAVYGTVDPTHANYTISLDGAESQYKASSARTFHTQTLLYFAQGLESKQHTITLTGNPGTNSSLYFDLDYLTVYSAPNATSTSSQAPSATSTNPANNNANSDGTVSGQTSNNSSLSQGSIIGIVVGSIAALLLLLLGIFFWLRRRRARAKAGAPRPHSAKPSPGIPIQSPPDLEAQYDYTLREKEVSPEDLRPSIDFPGRSSESDDYYDEAKTVTAHLLAFPAHNGSSQPSGRLSPAPSGRLSPGVPPSGRLSPGIPPSGRLSPGIPPSGRLSPGLPASPRLSPGLPVSPRLAPNPGLSPTPRLSPIPQLSPMPGYSPVPMDDKRPPPRSASRPDEVPTFVVHDPPESSHSRMPSDTSTVVSDEVEAGLSEIILSPSKSQRRPPASPRSPRPREELRRTQFSGLDYYYDS